MHVCTLAGKGKGNTNMLPKYVSSLDKSRDTPSRRNRGSSSVISFTEPST